MSEGLVAVITGIGGTILGSLLTYLFSRGQAEADRKEELRSYVVATIMELDDAMRGMAYRPPVHVHRSPSLELIVQRGLLMRLPAKTLSDALVARSFLDSHERVIEILVRGVENGDPTGSAGRGLEFMSDTARDAVPRLKELKAELIEFEGQLRSSRTARVWRWLRTHRTTRP